MLIRGKFELFLLFLPGIILKILSIEVPMQSKEPSATNSMTHGSGGDPYEVRYMQV